MLARVGAADLRSRRGCYGEVVGDAVPGSVRLLEFEVQEVESKLADVVVDPVDVERARTCPRVHVREAGVHEVGVVVVR